ncbi:Ig-like domain-containing protein [Cyclobacterium jeungdonense]|uniref:Ig-like domain-containing protein n=1 Tax=Cyclobacterium jeungdonense TaxID=708087 RepID=A0ABT8C810_9BACT|nr:Ig-like domain-containing protein [Cyclobacterium jeungdonense]MDN3688536.1 Ig-like domain-containing protein [Cyclobacterium jeungdonense]
MKRKNYKTRLWLTALAAVSIGALFGGCKDEFEEVLGICPEVESTNPDKDAVGIQLNNEISVTFNEAMNPASISPGVFSLKVVNASASGRMAIASEAPEEITGELTFEEETNKMSFKPDVDLLPNTTYTGRVEPVVADKMGNVLQAAYEWNFTTGVSPAVTSTSPANQANGVPLDQTITATFSTEMDASTITAASYKLMAGTTVVTGEVTYSDNTASFDPENDLLAATTYTGTITMEAKTKDGIPMAIAYNWTFDTGTAPRVLAIDPLDLATGVSINKIIKVTFSEPMEPATITAASFTVSNGSTPVSGTVTYSESTAVFTPAESLLVNTTYSVSINKLAKNSTEVSMAQDFESKFTTGNSSIPEVTTTDPADNATSVALNKAVMATFSEAMDHATITESTFTLTQGNTAVAGTVSYSGATASFKPTSALSANLTYTGTITTGAMNAAGAGLAEDYVWTFTTVAMGVPAVLSTDPMNNATNVALNKVVKATFSEGMAPATITGNTFTLTQGNTTVAGTVSYSGTTASFTPTNPLSYNLTYTGTITTGAENVAGTGLAEEYVWTFTMVPPTTPEVLSTDPMNNAENVPQNKVVRATFSKAMDPASISGMTFTLQQGTENVSGSVSYSGTTASFTPASLLSPNLSYTATISTGAKSEEGVALESDYVWNFNIENPVSPYFVDLNTAERFGIFAATGVSNNAGFSEIRNLDVGISPGVRTSVTGFPPAIVENGAIFASDDVSPSGVAAMLSKAKLDLTAAYLFAEGATTPAPATVEGDQGGKTLAPGIYKSTSTLLIQNGDLTLDAQGNPNAVWIFQIASGFTTVGGAGGNIILSGGAQAKNIFWQIGSSATIGDNTKFHGNVLARTSITMNSGATIVGRLLVLNGAVVMTDTNTIERP